MKLVITYAGGSESSYWDCTFGFECESKDAFELKFLTAFEEWGKKRKEWKNLQRKYSAAVSSGDQAKITAAQNALHTHGWNHEIEIDGRKFSGFEDFEYNEKKDEYTMTSFPGIYTLEEWWEQNQAPLI